MTLKRETHIYKIYLIFYVTAACFFVSIPCVLQAATKLTNIAMHKGKNHDGLYYVQCKKTGLFIVLEKLDHKNIQDWIRFVKRQEGAYGCALNKYAVKKILPSLNGMSVFKKRLLNYETEQLSKSQQDYDMYASYLIHTNPESVTKDSKFGVMSSLDSSEIVMVTTVQVSRQYDLYSALGISRTVDEAVRICKGSGSRAHNANSIPMHMYAYTYYILKNIYTNLQGFVSTPVLTVRKILKKFILKEFISVGARFESDFSKLPWVQQDVHTFAYSIPSEPDFFKGAVITKIEGSAFFDYLKNNINLA